MATNNANGTVTYKGCSKEPGVKKQDPSDGLTREDTDRLFDPNRPPGPEVHDHATCTVCGPNDPGTEPPGAKPLSDHEKVELRKRIEASRRR